jgi:hypothetical protein
MAFPTELLGKLWHTTSVERYRQIVNDGSISPNPPIEDSERWKTNRGPDYYPYVRTLGGVSLFDFNNFNEDQYSEEYPLSNWTFFVPYTKRWKASVWIEINRKMILGNFISGQELLLRWKQEEAYKHTFMPIIEAAHIGLLPITAFGKILISHSNYPNLKEFT